MCRPVSIFFFQLPTPLRLSSYTPQLSCLLILLNHRVLAVFVVFLLTDLITVQTAAGAHKRGNFQFQS